MSSRSLPSRPTYQRLVLSRTLDTQKPPPVQIHPRPPLLKPLTVFLLCLAFVALAGFSLWQYRTIRTLNRKLVWLKQHAASTTPPTAERATTKEIKTVMCPLCRGEKVVVYGDDLLHRRREKCPVCKGVGYRNVEVPSGHKLCPDCQGMGVVYYPYQPREPVRSGECARCGGTGVVASFDQAAKYNTPAPDPDHAASHREAATRRASLGEPALDTR